MQKKKKDKTTIIDLCFFFLFHISQLKGKKFRIFFFLEKISLNHTR